MKRNFRTKADRRRGGYSNLNDQAVLFEQPNSRTAEQPNSTISPGLLRLPEMPKAEMRRADKAEGA